MRQVIIALFAVVALLVAGVGGTFATWSDSETSEGNYIETGSVDLLVNGADDLPWGVGVPPKVELTCMIPQKVYGPFEVELWNASQDCMPSAHAYIHLKDYECTNVAPKEGSGYLDPYMPPEGWPGPHTRAPESMFKPEPELVAEYGGKVDCQWTDGIGPEGDESSMGTHTMMIVTTDPTSHTSGVLYRDVIGKWDCQERYLFDLEPCQPRFIYLWFILQQDNEEQYGYDLIPDPGDDGYDLQYWLKFNDWPSWALMKDKVYFNLEFDLWLEDP